MDDRYKKRGLKFNNNLDSRALRAVHNQQRQRNKRDDVLKTRRQIDDIQDSPQVADLPKKRNAVDRQAELYQKGLERYQNLLKWKEMKKKQLEKEKKRRMPSFKTGVYHPSPPKFLVSEDQHESSKTPHASLKKKAMTPGASLRKVPVFHLGGTPATSLLRVPQFHTGLTPKVSTKNQASMVIKQDKQENRGPFLRAHGALKNGTRPGGKRGAARGCTTHSRKLGDQEDLGVKPLPLTPRVTSSQRKAEKSTLPSQTLPSFAPADFAFNFEAPQTSEAKRTEHLSSGCIDDPISSQALEVSLDHSDARKEDMAISKEVSPMKECPSILQKNDDGDISETGDCETQSVYKNDLFPQEDNIVCTSDTTENENSPHKEAFGPDTSKTSENEIQPDPVTLSDELPGDSKHQEKSEPENNLEMLIDEKIDEEPAASEEKSGYDQVKPEDESSNLSNMNTYALEVLDEDDSRPKRKRLSTPAKRVTRRSAACCLDGTMTPLLSRLRPRTPCSRSTRRSLSAHCDMPIELCTPARRSTKKTPRRSVSKSAKRQVLYEADIGSPFPVPLDGGINDAGRLARDNEDRMMDAKNTSEPQLHPQLTPGISLNDPSLKESSSPLMTPENILRREQGLWTVETSPWVNLQRSKKKKFRVSDLQGAFDDIPVDGSPVSQPVIPSGLGTSLGEDTTCTNLLSLLQPSDSQNTESPVVNVWSEESPAIGALGSPKSSRQKRSSEKAARPRIMAQEPAEVQTAYANVSAPSAIDPAASEPSSPSPDILSAFQNGKNKEKSQKRKSRKSVMFAVTEEEDVKADSCILPGTPVCRSTRVSMGLFAKVDPRISETVIPGQDLIAFDSPITEKNTSSTSRRKSCRVSLLPGMTLSPAKEEAGSIPTDLITWDSPCETKRASGHAVPSLPTPVRRSRRLSKAM
ncbi:uncharacterized protein LOC127007270 [Eriocheir sinensis]|uniref:uncharacterized protein LOC127007270 n=1 Tax=Eriocheir sinensis TaxID=95602 RepID=UPI0021C62562|nr:uncharacterized protein LOC127007270 [Eriocheir sinensis]